MLMYQYFLKSLLYKVLFHFSSFKRNINIYLKTFDLIVSYYMKCFYNIFSIICNILFENIIINY